MNALKLLLLIVLLALAGTITGCQEGNARQSNLSKTKEFAWERGVTGFWQPNISYSNAD